MVLRDHVGLWGIPFRVTAWENEGGRGSTTTEPEAIDGGWSTIMVLRDAEGMRSGGGDEVRRMDYATYSAPRCRAVAFGGIDTSHEITRCEGRAEDECRPASSYQRLDDTK